VLEGAIRSQIDDGPVTIYKAGQSFSELPVDRHAISFLPLELGISFLADSERDRQERGIFAHTPCPQPSTAARRIAVVNEVAMLMPRRADSRPACAIKS
jgi:hypothetical protein